MFLTAENVTIGGRMLGGQQVPARSGTFVGMLIGAAVVAGCTGAPPPPTQSPTSTTVGPAAIDSPSPPVTSPSPRASLPSRPPRPTATPLPEYVTAVIKVGQHPGYAEVAFESVWVGNHHGNSISRIDPAANAVIATIPVPGEPTGVTAAFGSIWTFTPIDRMIKRVDPATNEVTAALELEDSGGSITGVAELGGFLWFAGDSGQIRQIDPDAMRVVASLDMHADCPGSLAAAGGRLWYAPLCGGDGVAVIEPDGLVVRATIAAPGANAVSSAGDIVWTSSTDGTITKIDASVEKAVATGSAGPRAEQLRAAPERVWVRVDADLLVALDGSTLEVKGSYTLPPAPIPGGGIAIGDGAVWAVNFGEGTVWRISP